MAKKRPFQILLNVLVIVGGSLALWNFSFFWIHSGAYPPIVSYHSIPGNSGSPDSAVAAPGVHYQVGALGRFLLGEHYRHLWALPVKVPVFGTRYEGQLLKVLKRGGGMQTTSFSLRNQAGQSFMLRSVDKDPVPAIPEFWQHTFISKFVRDQVSATDPYAFLIVNELAKAVKIAQPKASLVFVKPYDSRFSRFGFKAGGFFALGPKLPGLSLLRNENQTFIGVYPTSFMLRILERSPSFASVDTAYYLRCRLFDLYISDWDRHVGQWDWAAFSEKGDTIFKALPKDRDQALGYYEDGFLPKLLSSDLAVRKITSFSFEYKDVEGFTQNGEILDKRFLKGVKENVFLRTAQEMKAALTDQVLKQAVGKYPAGAYQLAGPEIYKKLKNRREKLPEAAKEFTWLMLKVIK
jgi:hypothetical protein